MCRNFFIGCLASLIALSLFADVLANAEEHFRNPSETENGNCRTKGTIGDQCKECDIQNHYYMDPVKKSCYYTVTTDYQYTFNLSKREDIHFSQINFKNSPPKEYDADFAITCSLPAKINITAKTKKSEEKLVYENYNCSTTCTGLKFPRSLYEFEGEDGTPQTTFFVNVYDFKPPLWIRVSFSQYPVLNLARYNITVATLKMMGIWNSTNNIVSKILAQENIDNKPQSDNRNCRPIE